MGDVRRAVNAVPAMHARDGAPLCESHDSQATLQEAMQSAWSWWREQARVQLARSSAHATCVAAGSVRHLDEQEEAEQAQVARGKPTEPAEMGLPEGRAIRAHPEDRLQPFDNVLGVRISPHLREEPEAHGRLETLAA